MASATNIKNPAILYWIAGILLFVTIWIWRSSNSTDHRYALTIYSGRSEQLIQPLVDQFSRETGIRVRIRYGHTAEMVATILEEGRNSPADVILAQDAGSLGALAKTGHLETLPASLLDKVDTRFQAPDGDWIGISGRAFVLVYHIDRVPTDDLPSSLNDLLHPKWNRRIGWAPQNGSFQAFVTAMRVTRGEDAVRDWLTGLRDNGARSYAKNTPVLLAVAAGEIDMGLINHYYLHAVKKQMPELPLANHYLPEGTLLNIAGGGILQTSSKPHVAKQFLEFLLSDAAQTYFTEETFEYPLTSGIKPNPVLSPLELFSAPLLNLGDLDDLAGTLRLLRETRIL